MKVCHSLFVGVGSLFFITLAACVNHISEEKEILVNNGSIPLKFVADIRETVHTRVADNSFEQGDTVGLFALVGNTTMQEERYVNNLYFIRSSEGEFIAEDSIYYPDDDVTLKLISYYPYRKEGVEMGESKMSVFVEKEQNTLVNYTHSDFLIAAKKDVSASKQAIPLTYKHKFFRLKAVLVPGEGEDIEAMLTADPKLSVYGFYTKAMYDFQRESYSGYSEEEAVTSFGKWEIKDERLVGKELILIPQEATAGYQYMLLEVGGKLYSSFFPSTFKLEEGKQREVEITFVAAEDVLMSKIQGEIDDWEGTDIDPTESVTLHKSVNVSKLGFENSNVCKVLHAGKQVAEICKEYLVTPDFSSQAIVAYPMKENETADLSQGVVVQLLGQSGNVHGGRVSWNTEDHSLSYIAGTLPLCERIYVTTDGKISLSISALILDDALPVLVLEDVVRDVRGGSIHNYPLVKIGTQYWMRDNMEATLYINGNEISRLDSVIVNKAGYLQSATKRYFYTESVALSNEFLPAHWDIPKWGDWDILKDYLKNDASLLKSGKWVALNKGEVAHPANNLSGFNGFPVGIYVGKYQSDYESRYVAYWTLNDTGKEIADMAFYLKSDMNTVDRAKVDSSTKAFAIRCIRRIK